MTVGKWLNDRLERDEETTETFLWQKVTHESGRVVKISGFTKNKRWYLLIYGSTVLIANFKYSNDGLISSVWSGYL